MPTYSYRCEQCGKVFDAFHSMSCTDAQHCPECHGIGRKLMSASSVIFKGSGFYSTDYRDSGYLEAKKKDTEKASETKSSDQAKDSSKTKSNPVTAPNKIENSTAKSDTAVAAAA